MPHKITFKKSLIASALFFSALQVNAAGFQLNAQSATGLGRAFAGDAVIADNASVMARNAAAMALFEQTELSLGLNVIATEIDVSNASYQQQHLIAPGVGYSDDSNYSDAGDTSLAPNIHLIVPISEQFAVGANLYSNFGTKTEFDDSFVGSEYGGLTDVKSINLGLAASYRINKQWSVGGGLDIIYGQGKLEREVKVYSPINGQVIQSQEALNADASGFGLGFNLGTVFELDENNRFGLSYHYSPELEAKGDISFGGNTSKDDTLYMPLPDMAEFSGYHRLTDSLFAVHYSVQWIGWSAFDTLDSKAFGTINEYQWKDAMHFSLGGTYYLSNNWTLRAGYMYDQSAQDKVTSISVPDSDRQWFSAGFSYHFSNDSSLDVGATYLLGQDVSVTETTEMNKVEVSRITGTTHANAILVAVQYSHRF
ncbi:aromatic hydrocarbon degradation protein [Psychromonas sp. psych-6C06]|uniref:outer membrane protein transport protein n=1 Tax=Psychromonas sp. psych-6C06 TaxID=2058089 RepID=UPI000C33A309|nr:outer membrane protein transport protein [Psychromonas sp. psych-6C06]PKF63377.1 aromatic hydrocarbon degradation protein [Psychromonas sp. psych-6C06]